jgi:hypothetical protein
MAAIGTKRTSSDVRPMVAIGGKADMALTAQFVEIGPLRKSPALEDVSFDRSFTVFQLFSLAC